MSSTWARTIRRGACWSVILVAKPGWNSSDELGAIDGVIEQFGVRPDAVVLAYVLNDIAYARALGSGMKLAAFLPTVDLPAVGFWDWLTRHSYLVNDLGLQRIRSQLLVAHQTVYWQALMDVYADPDIWTRHAEDLHAMIDRCRELDAPLTVVVFPHLADVELTRETSAFVTRFFKEHGVDAIDLGLLYA